MKENPDQKQFDLVLQEVRKALSSLPPGVYSVLRPALQRQIKMLASKVETPKIVLYGRTGAGKSSLINAILGKLIAPVSVARPLTAKTEIYTYERDGWPLNFIDSQGVGTQDDRSALEQAVDYISKEKPNILLFVVEVDERAFVAQDVHFCRLLMEKYKAVHKKDLPVVLVLTKIDRVEPLHEWNPPYDMNLKPFHANAEINPLKAQKEYYLREHIRARLDSYKTITSHYIPVCTFWTEDEDRRWNIDSLAELIYDLVPEQSKAGFAGAVDTTKIKITAARALTYASASLCAISAVTPVIFGDVIAIAALQIHLVSLIARLGSGNTDKNRVATKFIENVGTYGLRIATATITSQLKYIPGIGQLLAIPVAAGVAATTIALGEAAIKHFIEGNSVEVAAIQAQREKIRIRETFELEIKETQQKLRNKKS